MAGLLEAFGVKSNPFTSFVGDHRSALLNFGAGLAGGRDFGQGVSMGLQGAALGRQADDAYATSQKAEAERVDQINKTREYLASDPLFADLVPLVDAGQGGAALTEAFKRKQPGYGQEAQPDPFTLSAGETRYAPDGSVLASMPSVEKPAPAPSGYQPSEAGGLEFIPGGPADPATAGKTTEATRRNQQLAKVIVPEIESLLGTDTKPGTFEALSDMWSQGLDAAGPVGFAIGGGPAEKYQQAKNSLKTIIASYLYSVSGATANPGEVETQASVLTPKPGEPKASVDDKKRRISTMVQAVVDAAKGTPIDVGAPAPVGRPGVSGAPQPGAVEDGYRFKGGNPSDPNSWEPA